MVLSYKETVIPIMVVKVYVSGISGNKEVKKRQQRVLMILDSKNVKYDVIDITEPGKETDKEFMQNFATSNGGTVSDPNPRSPLPPQLFNDDEYCGDYDQFDLANEVDTLEQFLKLEVPPEEPPQVENGKENGDVAKESKESSQEKEILETETVDSEAAPAKDKTPSRETTPTKGEEKPSREATPAKVEEKTSREVTPAKGEEKSSREATPAKGEEKTSREATPAKDGKKTSREATPAKDGEKPSREATPAKGKDKKSKENTPDKESTPDRQKPVEKEPSPVKDVEEKQASKENTPEPDAAKENGTASSRDHSVEKEVTETVERKKDPSELLIESEQSAE